MIQGKKRLARHGAAWKRLTRKNGGRPRRFRPAFQPLEQRRLLALVISEIMYNPSSNDDDWEWIELHNDGAEAVDLSGYVVDDNNNSPLAEANIAAGVIAAGESAVLHSDAILAADFEAAWGPGINLIAVPSLPSLGNGGDRIGIWASFNDYDADHLDHLNAVDDVPYDDLAPWPIEDEGVSIYLTDPSLDNSVGDNWAISQPNIDGGGQSVFTNGNSGGEVGSPGVIPGDPRIVVIQTNALTSVVEGGADDQYTIALATIPSNPVDITINVGVELQVSLDGNNFAASQVLTLNDAAPQTVMVRAVDDLVLEGGHSAVITHGVTAASPEYPAGAPVADVRVNITDNDDVPVNLLITEIMYHTNSSNSWEWVEIYNNGTETVNLAGFVFDDNNGTSHNAANIAEGSVPPGQTAILHNSAVSAVNFSSAWTDGLNLIAVANWGGAALSLGNGGDKIGIWSSFAAYLGDHQAHNNVVEGVEYFDDAMFWPVDVPGSSIYLTSLESPNDEGANWATSIEGQEGAIRSTNAGGNLGNDLGSPGVVPVEPVAPGVSVISPDAQTMISEGGLQDEYAIRLDTLPAGTVRIEISIDVGGEPQSELSLDGVNFAGSATLSFNSVTGTTPQTVYVRAIDDAETEGVHESVLSHRIIVTGDPDNYPPANVDPDFIADLHVLVADNDPPSSPLIITEIMYAPSPVPEEDWEWVEVYNSGDVPIDLSGYVLDDDDGTALAGPNIEPLAPLIPAGGIGLLYNPLHEGFVVEWQIADDVAVIPVSAWSGLANGNERISLWDSFALYQGDHVDHNNAVVKVDYNDAAPWPEDPDGASIYLKDLSGGPRRIADSFNGGFELNWTFVSDAGAVTSPNPTRVEVVDDSLRIEVNADDLPAMFHQYVSAFSDSQRFEDVIVRATIFPLDTTGGAPTVSGGMANSNNDQFVTARVKADGQDGYLLVFDYGTRFLNLARSDNGVVFVPQNGVDGDNVSLIMGGDIDRTQPYVIELELVGDSITGRVFAEDGVTLLYDVQWTDDMYDEGRVGFGAAINADLDTATFLSAGFDDFSAVALNEVSNGAAWALSELEVDGAIQGTAGDVGSPGLLPPLDTEAPKVTQVKINAGIADPADLPSGPQPAAWRTQRSDLRSILVTFSEPVQVAAADLMLTNLGRNAVNDPDTIVQLDDAQLTLENNVLTIAFESYALEDGVYQLEILGSVTDAFDNPLDGNGDGVAGDEFVYAGSEDNGFYKLAGDFNGDWGTTIFDFPVFAYWFGRAVPLAPEYADINQDLGVSIFDFPNFALNFGAGVVFPAALAAAPLSFESGEQAAEAESLVESNQLIDRSFASLWRVDSAPRQAKPGPARPAGSPTAAVDAALEDLMKGEAPFIW